MKGTGNRSKKKRRATGHSNSNKESDFVEDLLRDYKKKSEIKGKRVKFSLWKRDFSSSDDDVTLAHSLEKKIHLSRRPDKELGGKGESGDEDSQEQGIHEGWENRNEGIPRSVKGMHGNPGAILMKLGS